MGGACHGGGSNAPGLPERPESTECSDQVLVEEHPRMVERLMEDEICHGHGGGLSSRCEHGDLLVVHPPCEQRLE